MEQGEDTAGSFPVPARPTSAPCSQGEGEPGSQPGKSYCVGGIH